MKHIKMSYYNRLMVVKKRFAVNVFLLTWYHLRRWGCHAFVVVVLSVLQNTV